MLLAVMVAVLALDAPQAQTPPAVAPIRLFVFGTQIWEIPLERAKAQPHWNLEAEVPPMPLSAATQKGRTWVAARVGDRPLELNSAYLQRMRRSPDVDFWCYRLGFNFVGQPGPPLNVVVLPDGSIVEPTPSGTGADAPLPPPPAALPPGVVRPGNGVTIPKIVREVKPDYTPAALRAKISGSVQLECVVGVDGATHDCRVTRSLDQQFGLDQAALKAAAQWRFEPGARDGVPVPVMVSIELGFYLGK